MTISDLQQKWIGRKVRSTVAPDYTPATTAIESVTQADDGSYLAFSDEHILSGKIETLDRLLHDLSSQRKPAQF